MSKTARRVELGDRSVILVGTAHISPESIDEVGALIREELPARVCVEIDSGRWKSMNEDQGWASLDIGKVLKEGKGFLLMANLALSGFQRRMGEGVGVRPGDEMLAAAKTAEELGIPYDFCDREVQLTLKRAWAKSSLWNKAKLIASLAESAFSSEKLSEEDIEKLKDKGELEEMMGELADYLPSVKEVLIDERDRYLASKIFASAMAADLSAPPPAATGPAANTDAPEAVVVVGAADTPADQAPAADRKRPAVIAVVGAGHLGGIEAWLGRLAKAEVGTDVAELETLPRPSPWGKIAGWAIPVAIVGLIVAGFLRSGAQASLALLLRWVLFNGSLAALGSALCFAHPLTILASFVAAPIATLNPFVGVGLFAGLAEAFLRKPRVSDFETLAEDVTSFRGFYKNRITHILLVFFISSIGGMIGNFIALPVMATKAIGG
jgi:pheromone shutdown protein TraB